MSPPVPPHYCCLLRAGILTLKVTSPSYSEVQLLGARYPPSIELFVALPL